MAVLLIDIGNTRWKYSLCASVDEPVVVVEYSEPRVKSLAVGLGEALHTIKQVAVSSVGQSEFLLELESFFRVSCGVGVHVAKVERDCDGFHVSYADVSKLGVDRWLAMLAARMQLNGDERALVADCGTAITLEHMNRDEHLGGLIAPGLGLMAKSLNVDTADLPSVNAADGLAVGLAHSTERAIKTGCASAALAVLQIQQQRLNADKLLLTGGDMDVLSNHLPGWQCQSELVLEGLRLWLRCALSC